MGCVWMNLEGIQKALKSQKFKETREYIEGMPKEDFMRLQEVAKRPEWAAIVEERDTARDIEEVRKALRRHGVPDKYLDGTDEDGTDELRYLVAQITKRTLEIR